jgi:hypothetical protein
VYPSGIIIAKAPRGAPLPWTSLRSRSDGSLRQPTQRIHDAQILCKGLVEAGLEPTEDPFRDFFVGRNPG